MNEQQEKRRWFDGTINVPTIITVVVLVVSGVTFGVSLYNGMDHRVVALENESRGNADRFQRIEQAQRDSQSDIRSALRDLSDKMDRLLFDRAGVRPETQRWSK